MRFILTLVPILLTACAAAPSASTRPSSPINVDLATFQFKFDPDHGTINDIPPWIRDLDNRNIVIDGYMIPLDQSEKISKFALLNKQLTELNQLNMPKLQDEVVCKMLTGKTVEYSSDRLRIYGKMHVALVKDGHFIVSLYTLDVDRVEAAPDPSTFPSSR